MPVIPLAGFVDLRLLTITLNTVTQLHYIMRHSVDHLGQHTSTMYFMLREVDVKILRSTIDPSTVHPVKTRDTINVTTLLSSMKNEQTIRTIINSIVRDHHVWATSAEIRALKHINVLSNRVPKVALIDAATLLRLLRHFHHDIKSLMVEAAIISLLAEYKLLANILLHIQPAIEYANQQFKWPSTDDIAFSSSALKNFNLRNGRNLSNTNGDLRYPPFWADHFEPNAPILNVRFAVLLSYLLSQPKTQAATNMWHSVHGSVYSQNESDFHQVVHSSFDDTAPFLLMLSNDTAQEDAEWYSLSTEGYIGDSRVHSIPNNAKRGASKKAPSDATTIVSPKHGSNMARARIKRNKQDELDGTFVEEPKSDPCILPTVEDGEIDSLCMCMHELSLQTQILNDELTHNDLFFSFNTQPSIVPKTYWNDVELNDNNITTNGAFTARFGSPNNNQYSITFLPEQTHSEGDTVADEWPGFRQDMMGKCGKPDSNLPDSHVAMSNSDITFHSSASNAAKNTNKTYTLSQNKLALHMMIPRPAREAAQLINQLQTFDERNNHEKNDEKHSLVETKLSSSVALTSSSGKSLANVHEFQQQYQSYLQNTSLQTSKILNFLLQTTPKEQTQHTAAQFLLNHYAVVPSHDNMNLLTFSFRPLVVSFIPFFLLPRMPLQRLMSWLTGHYPERIINSGRTLLQQQFNGEIPAEAKNEDQVKNNEDWDSSAQYDPTVNSNTPLHKSYSIAQAVHQYSTGLQLKRPVLAYNLEHLQNISLNDVITFPVVTTIDGESVSPLQSTSTISQRNVQNSQDSQTSDENDPNVVKNATTTSSIPSKHSPSLFPTNSQHTRGSESSMGPKSPRSDNTVLDVMIPDMIMVNKQNSANYQCHSACDDEEGGFSPQLHSDNPIITHKHRPSSSLSPTPQDSPNLTHRTIVPKATRNRHGIQIDIINNDHEGRRTRHQLKKLQREREQESSKCGQCLCPQNGCDCVPIPKKTKDEILQEALAYEDHVLAAMQCPTSPPMNDYNDDYPIGACGSPIPLHLQRKKDENSQQTGQDADTEKRMNLSEYEQFVANTHTHFLVDPSDIHSSNYHNLAQRGSQQPAPLSAQQEQHLASILLDTQFDDHIRSATTTLSHNNSNSSTLSSNGSQTFDISPLSFTELPQLHNQPRSATPPTPALNDCHLSSLSSVVPFGLLYSMAILYYRQQVLDLKEHQRQTNPNLPPHIQTESEIAAEHTVLLLKVMNWLSDTVKSPIVYATTLIEFDYEETMSFFNTGTGNESKKSKDNTQNTNSNLTPQPLLSYYKVDEPHLYIISDRELSRGPYTHGKCELMNDAGECIENLDDSQYFSPYVKNNQSFKDQKDVTQHASITKKLINHNSTHFMRSLVGDLYAGKHGNFIYDSVYQQQHSNYEQVIKTLEDHYDSVPFAAKTVTSPCGKPEEVELFPYDITENTLPLWRSFLYHLQVLPTTQRHRLFRHSNLMFTVPQSEYVNIKHNIENQTIVENNSNEGMQQETVKKSQKKAKNTPKTAKDKNTVESPIETHRYPADDQLKEQLMVMFMQNYYMDRQDVEVFVDSIFAKNKPRGRGKKKFLSSIILGTIPPSQWNESNQYQIIFDSIVQQIQTQTGINALKDLQLPPHIIPHQNHQFITESPQPEQLHQYEYLYQPQQQTHSFEMSLSQTNKNHHTDIYTSNVGPYFDQQQLLPQTTTTPAAYAYPHAQFGFAAHRVSSLQSGQELQYPTQLYSLLTPLGTSAVSNHNFDDPASFNHIPSSPQSLQRTSIMMNDSHLSTMLLDTQPLAFTGSYTFQHQFSNPERREPSFLSPQQTQHLPGFGMYQNQQPEHTTSFFNPHHSPQNTYLATHLLDSPILNGMSLSLGHNLPPPLSPSPLNPSQHQ